MNKERKIQVGCGLFLYFMEGKVVAVRNLTYTIVAR